ncbi:MAG TPA: diacylglycerol kinase family protein, partial [Chitinophagaceae bacterium]|nr:diacylglycerol kinase family protein [Chitinophagaceae bacterium]
QAKSMQKKFMYVVNPISGGGDKEEINSVVASFAEASGIELITFVTSAGQDEPLLYALYQEHRPERIIIAGGDGTIKLVAELFEKEPVILGIIPAGSANGLSVDLGLPQDLEGQLQVAFFNDYAELDMVCINGRKSLHLSDIGLNAELIRNYEQSSLRGKLGYAIQAVHTLTDEEILFSVQVEANGQVFESPAKMVVIANSQKYGTGVTINPGGVMDDGLFEIVVLKNLNLGIFSRILMGDIPLDTGDVTIIATASARLTTDIPVHFQVDGEYCGEVSALDVCILPRQMRLAVPGTFIRSRPGVLSK